MMTPASSSDPVEYVWPCGHYQDVKIEPAPAIPFAAVEFPIPLARPVKHFTEFEKGGIPALRKCCRCGDKYHLFRIPAECMGCSHSFRDPCTDCKIISVTGSREIATVEFRVTGDLDQTPKYWRCRLCEDINPFVTQESEAGNSLQEPRGLRCGRCSERFHESNWVISPFNVYLGTWGGKVVAESGPWHWSLAWHRDMAGKRGIDPAQDGCCTGTNNGRRRRAIPWIGKSELGHSNNPIKSPLHEPISTAPKRTRAPTLPTPPQSRSPSPSTLTRTRSKSCSSKGSPRSLPHMRPPPLSPTRSHRESKPPIPTSPPPPVPSGVNWQSRPLPPLPTTPKCLSDLQERGRPQSRQDHHLETSRDKAPSRARLQVRNSHQTHRRTRSGELTGGVFSPPHNARQLHSSKSQTFYRPSQSPGYMVPDVSSSFLLVPTPEPSPVPKIAILPESPMKERERSDSVVTSSSYYSTDSVAIGPHIQSEDLAPIVPMSPEEAAIMMAAQESSYSHMRARSSESSSSSTGSSINSGRSRSNNSTPRTPTTPKTPTPPARHSSPRYSLFPQISQTPQTCPPPAILRPSKSSTALPPPKVLRPSSSSAVLRPPPENGYGHLRSRSEGLRPVSNNPTITNFSQSKPTDVGMDAGLKLATNMALSLTHALPGTHIPGVAHTHGPHHHHARLGEQHYATIPEENRREASQSIPLVKQSNSLLMSPREKTNGPISTDQILDLYQDEKQGEECKKAEEKKNRREATPLSQDWEGFLDDDDDEDSDHEHGRHSWKKGHRRRQTLADALKPKNWF